MQSAPLTRNQHSGLKSSGHDKPDPDSVVARLVDSEKPTPTAEGLRHASVFARGSGEAQPLWLCLKHALEQPACSKLDRLALLHQLFARDPRLLDCLAEASVSPVADPVVLAQQLESLAQSQPALPVRVELKSLVEGLQFFGELSAACPASGLQRAHQQYSEDGDLRAFLAQAQSQQRSQEQQQLRFHATDSMNKRVKQLLVRLFERLSHRHKFVLQRVAPADQVLNEGDRTLHYLAKKHTADSCLDLAALLPELQAFLDEKKGRWFDLDRPEASAHNSLDSSFGFSEDEGKNSQNIVRKALRRMQFSPFFDAVSHFDPRFLETCKQVLQANSSSHDFEENIYTYYRLKFEGTLGCPDIEKTLFVRMLRSYRMKQESVVSADQIDRLLDIIQRSTGGSLSLQESAVMDHYYLFINLADSDLEAEFILSLKLSKLFDFDA